MLGCLHLHLVLDKQNGRCARTLENCSLVHFYSIDCRFHSTYFVGFRAVWIAGTLGSSFLGLSFLNFSGLNFCRRWGMNLAVERVTWNYGTCLWGYGALAGRLCLCDLSVFYEFRLRR